MTRTFGRFLRQNTIALLALFIALGGTTFAASTIVLPANSVGSKQLKKNAVITKKIKNNAVTGGKVKNDSLTGADVLESSLGKVPSAANADHATTADSATNATNATNATTAANANALGGLGSSVYLDRAAQGASGVVPIANSGITEILGPVSITVPAGVTFVQIDAQATYSGASAASTWIIWFQQDGACALAGAGFNNRPFGKLQDSLDQGTLSQHFVVGVPAGVHTFRLCGLSSTGDGNFYSRTLIAHTIPRGATGGATLGPAAHGTAGGGGSPTRAR
jgi:hypothetical protein